MLRTQTVTSLAQDGSEEAQRVEPVEVHMLAGDGDARPGGRRFGTLVHAVLALIDLQPSSDDVAAIADTQGKIVGATEEEVLAAISCVATSEEQKTATDRPAIQRLRLSEVSLRRRPKRVRSL